MWIKRNQVITCSTCTRGFGFCWVFFLGGVVCLMLWGVFFYVVVLGFFLFGFFFGGGVLMNVTVGHVY